MNQKFLFQLLTLLFAGLKAKANALATAGGLTEDTFVDGLDELQAFSVELAADITNPAVIKLTKAVESTTTSKAVAKTALVEFLTAVAKGDAALTSLNDTIVKDVENGLLALFAQARTEATRVVATVDAKEFARAFNASGLNYYVDRTGKQQTFLLATTPNPVPDIANETMCITNIGITASKNEKGFQGITITTQTVVDSKNVTRTYTVDPTNFVKNIVHSLVQAASVSNANADAITTLKSIETACKASLENSVTDSSNKILAELNGLIKGGTLPAKLSFSDTYMNCTTRIQTPEHTYEINVKDPEKNKNATGSNVATSIATAVKNFTAHGTMQTPDFVSVHHTNLNATKDETLIFVAATTTTISKASYLKNLFDSLAKITAQHTLAKEEMNLQAELAADLIKQIDTVFATLQPTMSANAKAANLIFRFAKGDQAQAAKDYINAICVDQS